MTLQIRTSSVDIKDRRPTKGQGTMKKHKSQHQHRYRVHGVGAGLQRAVCTECDHISIRVIEDGGVRAIINKPEPKLPQSLAGAAARA
ncbi:MAG: hypothetical protein ACN4GK_05800 [Acidimicrobiia bacterium]